MNENEKSHSGIIAMIKIFAALAILTVGVLAILMVLGMISKEMFSDSIVKYLTSIGIFAAVSGAIALLMRSR